jgi:hypothetical protein
MVENEALGAYSINKEGYFNHRNHYILKTRQDKMDDLWDMLVPDPDTPNGTPEPLPFNSYWSFFKEKAVNSFCVRGDELGPHKKFKTMHTQGLVAKV